MGDNLPQLHTSYLVESFDGDGTFAGLRNPITAEVCDLTDPAQVADWLLAKKAVMGALAAATRIANDALIPAMDRDARWTINRPGGSVSAPSPAPSQASDTWDGNRLYGVLEDLVKNEVISASAMHDAVEIETTYKAKTKGVKALLKLPAVAPYIETCRLEVETKPRSVTVK